MAVIMVVLSAYKRVERTAFFAMVDVNLDHLAVVMVMRPPRLAMWRHSPTTSQRNGGRNRPASHPFPLLPESYVFCIGTTIHEITC